LTKNRDLSRENLYKVAHFDFNIFVEDEHTNFIENYYMKTHLIKLLVLQLAIFAYGAVSSQEKSFYGKVLDNKTNEPIPGVYLVLNGVPVSFTNENGIFELSCDPLKFKNIVFQHLAYEPDSIELTKLKSDTTSIGLKEKSVGLQEVIVSAERIQLLLKRAHKQFVKTYRPFCYWAQSHYWQSLSYNGEPCGYLECTGYTFLPIPHPMVWPGVLLVVPLELRRTRENPLILQGQNKREINSFLQKGPFQVYQNLGEFAFFERIHPLAKFDFSNYEFKFDSTDNKNDNEYVLVFKQKKKVIAIGGWPLMGSTGKIWLDRDSLTIRKITSTFYRTIRTVQTEVSYITIGGITYPEKVKLNALYNIDDAKKSIKKQYSEMEINFLKIDPTPRHNYQEVRHNVEYDISNIVLDYDYHPLFWKKYPAMGNWAKFINVISHGNQDNEFYLGAKEPIFNKKDPYYKEHTGIMRESSLKFVEQMKKDLNINE